MKRITRDDLQSVVDRINRLTGNPMEPYYRDDNIDSVSFSKWCPNIGNYHLSGAYGGYALHQMGNRDGGIRDVLRTGHIPARELYYQMQAFIEGLQTFTAFQAKCAKQLETA